VADLSVIREIAPSARVAPDAVIGPFCVVGPDVTIGPGTRLERRVCVLGWTIIGSGNLIGEGCVLGAAPQDLKYRGETTFLNIGHRNRFGPRVTAHLGTEAGGYLTRIGDENFFMDGCHIAHDCYVDDRALLGRNVLLAGHVDVQTGAVIGDLAGLHHFTTIGRFARVGTRTPVRRDVPPFADYRSDGEGPAFSPPAVRGLHEEGVRAARLPEKDEKELRRAFLELFDEEQALQTKIEQLINTGVEGEASALCEFCQRSLRGVFGRHRERYRGRTPPEAKKYLTPDQLARIRRTNP